MSEMHTSPDRVVWFDLPVADLARASRFYGAVLGIKVHEEKTPSFSFAVLEHGPYGIESLSPLVAASHAAGAAALVRVADEHPQSIGAALDVGADGVIVPHV